MSQQIDTMFSYWSTKKKHLLNNNNWTVNGQRHHLSAAIHSTHMGTCLQTKNLSKVAVCVKIVSGHRTENVRCSITGKPSAQNHVIKATHSISQGYSALNNSWASFGGFVSFLSTPPVHLLADFEQIISSASHLIVPVTRPTLQHPCVILRDSAGKRWWRWTPRRGRELPAAAKGFSHPLDPIEDI